MKGFREWIFTLSNSVASTRPLSSSDHFLHGDRQSREPDDQSDEASSSSEQVTHNDTQRCSSSFEMENHSSPESLCDSSSNLTETKHNPLAKIGDLQVKFLRLVQRFGQSHNNLIIAKVLYRVHLAMLIQAEDSELKTVKLTHDNAKSIAKEQEAIDMPNLDFSLRILVMGKTGTGKSSTVNSILGQSKSQTDAFRRSTDRIQEVSGTVNGVNITFIDTPGFHVSSSSCTRKNRKLLLSIKKYTKNRPPDAVLYFDRLDTIDLRYSDFPLLKLITDVFGSAVWFNTILVLTHASAASEGYNRHFTNYESFVTQRVNVVQHYIHQAVSDTKLENPVVLVENHPRCRKNPEGESVLPNGQLWKPQFLFYCICTKVLSDVQSLVRFRDVVGFGQRSNNTRVASLPHLLSSFLRRRLLSGPDEADKEMYGLFLSDLDEEDEYDQLPSIRILGKSQFEKLSKSQKNEYLDELDYRETLYLKKQFKEECRKRCDDDDNDSNNNNDNPEDHAVVPLPDMAGPDSFESDFPAHRYRCVATSDQWLVRPVYDPQGWDRDVGFDGINVETVAKLKRDVFASVSGQMSKEKQRFMIQSEGNAAYTDPKNDLSYSIGVDLQSSGDDLMYSVLGGTKLKSCNNKNTADLGVGLTSFGGKCYVGGKVEDTVLIGKRLKVMVNTGLMKGSAGQTACGGTVEATCRGRDYPVRDEHVGITVTALSFNKEVVLNGSIQSRFRPTRDTRLDVSASLNSRKMGQACLKLSSSEHWEIVALISALSIFKALLRKKGIDDDSENGKSVEE